MTIKSCRDDDTEAMLAGRPVPRFQAFASAANKALNRLQAAQVLADLRNPPGNRFEALGGKRLGQYSIRINNQWRLCFEWEPLPGAAAKDPLFQPGHPVMAEIVDYH